MKPSGAWLAILVLSSFAGCLHPLRAPNPSTPPIVDVAPTLDLALPDIKDLKKLCLVRAMSAPYPLLIGASEEETRKIAFKNYYNAFLDAKGQREYLACLEKDASPKTLAKRHDAEAWLKSSQSTVGAAMVLFPEEKRIIDVEETFSDIDEKQGLRRLVVKLRDGSKTTIESRFDRLR